MGLYLLGRHFSFQPNIPNLTPSSPYSVSSYSGFYLRTVHLLPRYYMLTFSCVENLSNSLWTNYILPQPCRLRKRAIHRILLCSYARVWNPIRQLRVLASRKRRILAALYNNLSKSQIDLKVLCIYASTLRTASTRFSRVKLAILTLFSTVQHLFPRYGH